jgi:hypothetical protein
MALQNTRSPNFGNFGIPNLGVPRQNDILDVAPMANHKEHYKGEGGGFPKVQVVVNLVSLCMHVACLCTKNAPTMH